jgi:hypothetical protein
MDAIIPTLYVEELKAIMRGPFAWLGAAVVLLGVGGLAAVAMQDTWLDGYGIIAYGLVPLAFIPLAAGATGSRARGPVWPGSFSLLVVEHEPAR